MTGGAGEVFVEATAGAVTFHASPVRRACRLASVLGPAADGTEPRPLETVRLFGYDIARVDLAETVQHLLELADLDEVSYVVTTNVDHVVELSKNERFRRAYDGAAVRLADGAPIVALGRLLGRPLIDRVTGADLLPEVCRQAALLGLRVAIVGGSESVNAAALESLRSSYPGLDIEGWSPYGFDEDEAASLEIVRRLEVVKAKIVFFCFGAPRSEIWVAEHAHLMPPCVAVCAGAAVDFVAGEVNRAPEWVQTMGFEWFYRLVQEPGRLWKRYLVRDMAFLPIASKEIVAELRARNGQAETGPPPLSSMRGRTGMSRGGRRRLGAASAARTRVPPA